MTFHLILPTSLGHGETHVERIQRFWSTLVTFTLVHLH